MEAQRIILADGPRFLLEMLKRVILKSPGLQIVGEISDLERLPSVVEQTHAEWVIVSLRSDGKMPEVVRSFSATHPSVFILALAADGTCVKMRWMESHEKVLEGLSLDELVAILCDGHPDRLELDVQQ
jgi:DNA-binding NarL/FixJ family response regulator